MAPWSTVPPRSPTRTSRTAEESREARATWSRCNGSGRRQRARARAPAGTGEPAGEQEADAEDDEAAYGIEDVVVAREHDDGHGHHRVCGGEPLRPPALQAGDQ